MLGQYEATGDIAVVSPVAGLGGEETRLFTSHAELKKESKGVGWSGVNKKIKKIAIFLYHTISVSEDLSLEISSYSVYLLSW